MQNLQNDIMIQCFIEKEPKCLVWLRISMRKDYLIFWAGRLNGPTVSLTVRIDTSPLFVDTRTHTQFKARQQQSLLVWDIEYIQPVTKA